jgi:hypothetical protein
VNKPSSFIRKHILHLKFWGIFICLNFFPFTILPRYIYGIFQQWLWVQVLVPLSFITNSTPYLPYNLIILSSFNMQFLLSIFPLLFLFASRLTKTKLQHDQAKINIQWLPTMHNIPTTSLPHVLFIDHLGTKKNKWSPSFVRVSSYIPFSSFLSVYVDSSCLLPSCFLFFPWQQ